MVRLQPGAVGGWEVTRPWMYSENRAILIADGLGRGRERGGKERVRGTPDFLDSTMALETCHSPGKTNLWGVEQGPQ